MILIIRDGVVLVDGGTNLETGGFHKLSCLPGLDVGEMFVTVDDRLAGFVEDVENMSRFQDQGRQNLVQCVYESGYR